MDTHRLGSALWFGPKNQPLRGWLHKPTNDDALTSRRIVIVPGFGYEELTSGWGLRALAENLAEAGHTVLRYDHRGHGRSPVLPGPFGVDALADDAAELIRTQADAPVHFVGLSMAE